MSARSRSWRSVGNLVASVLPFVGSALSASCAIDPLPATAIAVAVKTDLALGDELAQVTYRVFAVDDDPDGDPPVGQFTAPVELLNWPFIVTRRMADEFLLSVEGFAPERAEPVIVYRERVRFETGKTLALPIFLARSCLEKRCMFGGLTCFGQNYGNTRAGTCEAIPGPRLLDPVERPGEESQWEPMSSPSIDAGPQFPTPTSPIFPGNTPTTCTPPRVSALCTPPLDASTRPQ